MKIIYTGIFFDENTRHLLKDLAINTFVNLMENIKLHHITLNFGKEESYLLGKEVEFEIVGYVKDDLCQAFIVNLPDDITTNNVPHITVAHSNKVAPKYSNELIANSKSFNFDNSIKFSGKVGYFCQGNRVKYEV